MEFILDDGIKTYDIKSKDGTVRGQLRINTTDYNFFPRAEKTKDKITELLNNIKNLEESTEEKDVVKLIENTDIEIKKEINNLFDDNNASNVIFGNQNCLNTLKGETFVERFFKVIMPVIKADFEAENKASQKRIANYTSQVQDHKKAAATKSRKKQS